MPKKMTLLLLLSMLVCLTWFAIPAFAQEAEASRPPAIYFDGQPMHFTEAPYIENGTTMVPFRAIFERMGLTVGWDPDAQKITGKGADLTIELTVGSDTAVVNGKEQQLSVQPAFIHYTTFVPLRFIIENSDKDVGWDNYLKEIYIADLNEQILHLFDKHYEYFIAEDLPGIVSTIDPAAPAFDQTKSLLEQAFAANDLYIDVVYEITELQRDQAIVETNQLTRSISGAPFQDSRVIALNRAVKVNGEWKIHATQTQFIDYLRDDLTEPGEVALSDSEQQAIRDVLTLSGSHMETEELAGERALYMADYPNLDLEMEQRRLLHEAYDFRVKVGAIELLSGSADEAKVKYAVSVSKADGPQFRDQLQTLVSVLRKDVDGSWKFASTELLSLDFRSESLLEFTAAEQ